MRYKSTVTTRIVENEIFQLNIAAKMYRGIF